MAIQSNPNPYPQIQCEECGAIGEAPCDCGAKLKFLRNREEERKAKHRQSNRKHHQKTKQNQRSSDIRSDSNVVPFEPIQEECEDCHDNEERWQRSLQNFASDAIAMRAMWKRHFDSWESFKPSKQTITLAEEAANEWAELVRQLKLRRK